MCQNIDSYRDNRRERKTKQKKFMHSINFKFGDNSFHAKEKEQTKTKKN